MRTTIDIDTPLLEELKAIQRKEGRSLGKIVSQHLAEALSQRRAERPTSCLAWTSRPMGARVDLTDTEALHRMLDSDEDR